MTKRASSLLISLFMLALSIGLLLLYFLFKDDGVFTPLTMNGSNISLKVGQSVYNYYTISNENAEISFEVSKDNIIEIDEEKITGINAGEVTVTLTATLEGQLAKTQIDVAVYNDGYSFILSPVENCDFFDDTLYVKDNYCTFQIDVYDQINQKIDNLKYDFSATDNAVLVKNMYLFQLQTRNDCYLIFSFKEIDFDIIIKVKLV